MRGRAGYKQLTIKPMEEDMVDDLLDAGCGYCGSDSHAWTITDNRDVECQCCRKQGVIIDK